MSTVPPVPQWTHDLTKMSQNDFQSICKLAMSHPETTTNKTPSTEMTEPKPCFLKSPTGMKTEDNQTAMACSPWSNAKTIGRFVHFLRCSTCGLESINKTRFDSHLPCSNESAGSADQKNYLLHTCSVCFACSTSQSLMDEHIDLFHKGSQVELIKTQELLKPASMNPTTTAASNTPSTLSPTSVATNTSNSSPPFRGPVPSKKSEDNGCLDLSTSTVATSTASITTVTPTSTSFTPSITEEQTKNGVETLRKCHICSAELSGNIEELARHLAFVHLIPMPLMIGQLAAVAAGMKDGQNKPPSSSSTPQNLPPVSPLPTLGAPGLLSLHENIPRCGWDLSSLLVMSNSLGQNSPNERLSHLPLPFGQLEGLPQQNPPPPFPLGSKNLFGLNFDLPPLPLLEQNGDSTQRNPPTTEPDFKRARVEAPLSMEGNPFFPRFQANSTGGGGGLQTPSSLCTQSSQQPSPLLPGFLPRMGFPSTPTGAQQLHQPLSKASSLKGPSESRSRQGDESSSSGANSGAPPGIVHNTLRKTKSDMKVIHRYLVQVKNDTREIHEIPPQDLCNYIQDFIVTAKKKDGHEYEPESLKAFVHSLERHLKYHNYPHSVLKDPEFAPARLVLSQRLNELRALSQANGSANAHRSQMEGGKCSDFGFPESHDGNKIVNFNVLLQTGLLGPSNPQALLNSIWLIVRTQFNVVGTQKHRTLTWGQFQCVTNGNAQDLLRFTSRSGSQEVKFCHGHGGPMGVRVFDGYEGSSSNGNSKRQTLPFDCVEIFNFFARLRPAECRGPDEPLYLCPDPSWERGGPWFKPILAGAQLLSRIPRLLGMKPPRDQMPPTQLPSQLPVPDGPMNSLIPNPHNMQSFSQLRDNLLATMNSLMTDKLGRSEGSGQPLFPPSFLNSQSGLAPENLSLLAAGGMGQFSQSSMEEIGKLLSGGDQESKPAHPTWNGSPIESSIDGSGDETYISSPKSLPSQTIVNNASAILPERKPTLTP
ncbi:unnamed protein product [Rodentolepis nana]|uniref:DUF3504 domain-containing protein n=1 Tax=Rodentolepis nana TaxID=102285 RepID=A0A0R3T578_RODNA|nr:unnamed protein product [Rodentolepis nana]